MNIFYVYAYLREDATPYYIGKGKGNRAYVRGKKERIHRPKDLSRIVILQDNLTEQEAFDLEKNYIHQHGRINDGTGILYNLGDGGEGNAGRVSPNKGKKFGPQSSELIKKRSAAISLATKGKPKSLEHIQHMSEARKGKSSSLKGRVRPELSKNRKNISSGNWFNNGIVSVRSHICPENFIPGRLKSPVKNKQWFNNGEISVMRDICPEGFEPGRLYFRSKLISK